MVIHQGLTQTQQAVYTAGKFGYSINDKDTSGTLTIGTGASNVDADEFTSGSVAWSDVEFEPDLSASQKLGANADNGLVKITTSTFIHKC